MRWAGFIMSDHSADFSAMPTFSIVDSIAELFAIFHPVGRQTV